MGRPQQQQECVAIFLADVVEEVVAVGFADLGLGSRSRCCRDCLANHGLSLVVLASHHLAMAWVAWGL